MPSPSPSPTPNPPSLSSKGGDECTYSVIRTHTHTHTNLLEEENQWANEHIQGKSELSLNTPWVLGSHLTIILPGRHYKCLHYTDEEVESQRG